MAVKLTLALVGLLLLLLLLIAASVVLAAEIVNAEAKEGCLDRCGNVSIPYPFGTNDQQHCYLSPEFLVTCENSSNPPQPLLWKNLTSISPPTILKI